MYFYMEKGKQYLDLRGDFILTHNDKLIKTRTKSAAPAKAVNADYSCVKALTFNKRILITIKVIAFIWGRNEALVPENTNLNKPHVNEPPSIDTECTNCIHNGNQSLFPGPCTGCGDTEYNNFKANP